MRDLLDTNRLARKEGAFYEIYDALEEGGVQMIVTPEMDYHFGNDEHLLLGVKGTIDAAARRWLVKNMKRARMAKAGRGGLSRRE